jgi:uncharacterized protein
MVFRFDRGELRPARKRADGSLRVEGYLTRSGVFEYRQPNGSIKREYRSPKEVFNADSLASLELLPLTDDHPTVEVNPSNTRVYAVGSVGENISKDGNKVRASLSITDALAISKVERGKVQISCGYSCDMIDEIGVSPDGEHYDSIQTNIVYNHVALVAAGRAGPEVRIRIDAAEQIDDTENSKKEDGKMTLEEALEAAAKASARADKLDAELAGIKAAADKQAGELDAVKSKLAASDKAKQDAIDSIPSRVAVRFRRSSLTGCLIARLDVPLSNTWTSVTSTLPNQTITLWVDLKPQPRTDLKRMRLCPKFVPLRLVQQKATLSTLRLRLVLA